jgi:hypothetical protein
MSTAPERSLANKVQPLGNSNHASLLLRRKCACGSPTSALTGTCPECKRKNPLQTKRRIGASNDPLESEADRVADQVIGRGSPALPSISGVAAGRVQRQEAPKEKTNQEKYLEGLEKLGEAFLKTPLGKELLEKIKQDALVKGASKLGKDFISTWQGKVVTGAAATGTVAALAATHKGLPMQIPEIPLDILTPGLSVQLSYKGPVDKPTEVMITFKFAEQAPKASGDRKPLSKTDKFRAETARMAAENAKFRASMTYPPGSPEDLQQKTEQEAISAAVQKFSGGPDIEATIRKYPWLGTSQPKSGLQLTMPQPSFGSQTPSLFGDEFKLKLPGEQKKKEEEPALQKKLSIGASNDPLEQEADRVADQVLSSPASSAVSTTSPRIQRFSGQSNEQAGSAPASVDHTLASSGTPLEPALRQRMEQGFGHDFSRVRIHTDAQAAASAHEVNANAYTVGHNVVFGAGRFAPDTQEGQRLIAHELTHVVQQGATVTSGMAPTPTLRRQSLGDAEELLDDLGLGGVEKEIIDLGKGLAGAAEEEVRNQLRALGGMPGTGAVFSKPGCPTNFCNPFADVGEARKNLVLTAPILLAGVAKVVSPRVVPLWSQYLFGGASPQNLTSSFGKDFTASSTTLSTANFIRKQVATEIKGQHRAILGSAPSVTVDLTPRMTKTLAAIDNSSGPNAMDFNVIGDIAGNIAGGIGKDQLSTKVGAQPSPFNDERTAAISATLTRTKKGIKVNPDIVFTIRDTIDLCPGNCGALTEQDATIPMSRFEATGLSGDVPFEITFPAPSAALSEFEIPVAWPAAPSKSKGAPKKKKAPAKSKSTAKPKPKVAKPETGKTSELPVSPWLQGQHASAETQSETGGYLGAEPSDSIADDEELA